MKNILISLALCFLALFCFSQVNKDSLYIPCGYTTYFNGNCFDTVHLVRFKSKGGYITCKVYIENIQPDKKGNRNSKYFYTHSTHDSLNIILNHTILPKSKMYRLFVYVETCDGTCLEPKILRIDCRKPPD